MALIRNNAKIILNFWDFMFSFCFSWKNSWMDNLIHISFFIKSNFVVWCNTCTGWYTYWQVLIVRTTRVYLYVCTIFLHTRTCATECTCKLRVCFVLLFGRFSPRSLLSSKLRSNMSQPNSQYTHHVECEYPLPVAPVLLYSCASAMHA